MVFDLISRIGDPFKRNVLAACKEGERVNVSLLSERLDGSWGGTCGNITHCYACLGGKAIPVSALGHNAADYIAHFKSLNVTMEYVVIDNDTLSALCFVITDKFNDQLNSFSEGPTMRAAEISLAEVCENEKDVRLAIVSPSSHKLMLKQLEDCSQLDIDVIFDPGQQMVAFSGEDLRYAISKCKYVFGNEYEITQIQEKTGWSIKEIEVMGKTIVITYGEKGSSLICPDREREDVPACVNIEVDEPTGAGDAYRAGFMLGLERRYDLRICAQLGSVAASFVVEVYGAQSHRYDFRRFIQRYEENYGPFPTTLKEEWVAVPSIV